MSLEVWTDDAGLVHVRADASGERAVSSMVGDGGPEGVLAFIRDLAQTADLEVDDSEDVDGQGPISIAVPAGA